MSHEPASFEQQPLEVAPLHQRLARVSRGFGLLERSGGARAIGKFVREGLSENLFRPVESKEFFSKIFQEFDPMKQQIERKRGFPGQSPFARQPQPFRNRFSQFIGAPTIEEAAKAFGGPGVDTDFLSLLQSAIGEGGDLEQFQEAVSRNIMGRDIEQPIESPATASSRQHIQTISPEEAVARAQKRKEIVTNIRSQIGQARTGGQQGGQAPEDIAREGVQQLRQLSFGATPLAFNRTEQPEEIEG